MLEPPPLTLNDTQADGYAVLKFFGSPAPSGESDDLATSMEAYRWSPSGDIDISRRDSDVGVRFAGPADIAGASLYASGGKYFLVPGTLLTFVAAPDNSITADWDDTLYFGPPRIEPVDPTLKNDPVFRDTIRQAIAASEPERRHAARLRLEIAWRAPPGGL